MHKGNKKVSIDDLAHGNLPKHIIRSIGNLKMTVEDVYEWDKSHPPVYVAFKKGTLFFDLRIRWSIKKLLAIAGSLIGLIWAIMNFAFEYLPKLREWLSKT
jgi:hypothetical protein